MAELIKCKECGNQISSALAACPHCGLDTNPAICKGCNKPIIRQVHDPSKKYTELESYFHPECYKIHLTSKDIQQFSCPVCKKILYYNEITDVKSASCPNCRHPLQIRNCRLCGKLVETVAGVEDFHRGLEYSFYYHPSCIDAKLRENKKIDKGCFIATTIYGSSIAPPVIVLKEFRDTQLVQSFLGRGVVNLYYKVSPPIAEFISKRTVLKNIIKYGVLEPLVWGIKLKNGSR